jgi:hypothetical protein
MSQRTRVVTSGPIYEVREDLGTVVQRINVGRRQARAFITLTSAKDGRPVAVRPFSVLDVKRIQHP